MIFVRLRMARMVERRKLSNDEAADADRLRDAWARFQAANPGASQQWLAKESGLGGQTAVSQYLVKRIPLNLRALVAICRVIGVNPEDISPRLVKEAEEIHPWGADPETAELLDLFRTANPKTRAAILVAVRAMVSA